MKKNNSLPKADYGVLERNVVSSWVDEAAEQLRNLGYAVIDAGYSDIELEQISKQFDETRRAYIDQHGEAQLRQIDEIYTVRSPLTQTEAFLRLALNSNLLALVSEMIPGKFILNQQNGIVNPPRETYNQAAWHRDLPYQHFISSTPLAINALFCVDDFTVGNGATFVLPVSHKSEAFPSRQYVEKNALQVEAKAGSFIVLDCMLFHSGGFNRTETARRAVNHVFNIPFFKQQIKIPPNMQVNDLDARSKDILGFNYPEPDSVAAYLASRAKKS